MGNTQEAIENYQKSLKYGSNLANTPCNAKTTIGEGLQGIRELWEEDYQQALQVGGIRDPYINLCCKNTALELVNHPLQEKGSYSIPHLPNPIPTTFRPLSRMAYLFLASQLLDIMRQSYRAEGSKLTLAQNAQKVHTQAIDLCWEVLNTFHPSTYDAYLRLQQLNPEHNVPMPEKRLSLRIQMFEKSKAVVMLATLKTKKQVCRRHSATPFRARV